MIRRILVFSFALGVIFASTTLCNAQHGLAVQSPPQMPQRVTHRKRALIKELLEIVRVRKSAEEFIEVGVAQYEKDLPPTGKKAIGLIPLLADEMASISHSIMPEIQRIMTEAFAGTEKP